MTLLANFTSPIMDKTIKGRWMFMFEFIKNVFKHKEVKRIPGIEYVEVNRAPIERIELTKFEPGERVRFKSDSIVRLRYTDTGETVDLPPREAYHTYFDSERPVVIDGVVE